MTLFALFFALGCTDSQPDRHPTPHDPAAGPIFDLLEFDGAVPTNLLVLSIDTLRKDHLGAHGPHGYTPFLDGLAAESVVLDDHVQCSNWTTASTTCTLTGSTQIDRGVQLKPGWSVPEVPNLPTWLGELGFTSVLATNNEFFSAATGVTVGFDREEHIIGQDALKIGELGLSELGKAGEGGALPDRWYLHLHFMEPHYPYVPEPQFLEGLPEVEPWPDDLGDIDVMREIWPIAPLEDPEEQAQLEANLRRLYAGDVRMLDARLASVWIDLESRGLLDDTLVLVWTDHGDQFWEHGEGTHAYDLYGEENDAALWFWSKNLKPGRLDLPTQSIDLVPTLMSLYQVPIPDEVSGLPLDQIEPDRPRFTHADAKSGRAFAVIQDDLKLMYWWNGRLALYDRGVDPQETTPQQLSRPEVQELWCLLEPKVYAMHDAIQGDFAPVIPGAVEPCE